MQFNVKEEGLKWERQERQWSKWWWGLGWRQLRGVELRIRL